MTKPRRSFTDEFKREAVALLQSSGRPLMQIAEELGIQPSMLRNWRNAVGVLRGRRRAPTRNGRPRRLAVPVTNRPRSPGFVGKSNGCAWSEIF
jgi:transposase